MQSTPPQPLWKIEFEDEVKFYFLDNDPYTFELLAELYRLTYYTDPLEDCQERSDSPGVFTLAVLEHTVLFTFSDGVIRVLVVKPD
jgi:hypothetical protein